MTGWPRFILATLLALSASDLHAAPEPPDVLAPGALVMDAGTGKVLWSRNADKPRPIASTTKMMTALLIAESGRLDESVTVSEKASKVDEASLHLKPGEHITLRDLLYGIVLRSANDACVAAAEHLDGSVPAFVDRMNTRARELGCLHTHFVNPNGLHHKQHVSTPRDLAIIARGVLADPVLRDVVATKKYTIQRDRNRYDRRLVSRFQWFLAHYAGANGVKTGRTREAGRCFVASARRGQFELVSVVLHSPNVPVETKTLLDWGYRNYRGGIAAHPDRPLNPVRVKGGNRQTVSVAAAEPVPVVLPRSAPPVSVSLRDVSIVAPVKAGQHVGTAPVLSGGKPVGSVNLVATESVGLSLGRTVGRVVSGGGALLLLGIVVGSSTKNSGRRRRRVKTGRGGPDPRRARSRERPDRFPR